MAVLKQVFMIKMWKSKNEKLEKHIYMETYVQFTENDLNKFVVCSKFLNLIFFEFFKLIWIRKYNSFNNLNLIRRHFRFKKNAWYKH